MLKSRRFMNDEAPQTIDKGHVSDEAWPLQ